MSLPTRSSGFTLIEILLVLSILGLLSGMLLLTAPPSQSRSLEAELRGFQSLLQTTSSAAVRNSEHYGVSLTGNEWQLLKLDSLQSGRNIWKRIAWDEIDSVHPAHRWAADTQVSMLQENIKRQRQTARQGIARPDLIAYANGEMSSFTMEISALEDKTLRYKLQSDGLNLNLTMD